MFKKWEKGVSKLQFFELTEPKKSFLNILLPVFKFIDNKREKEENENKTFHLIV